MSDLRSTIEAAVDNPVEETHDDPVQVDSSVPESSSESDASSHESGSSDAVASPAADKKADGGPPSIEDVAGNASEAVEHKSETPEQKEARQRVDRAPQSWKGEAKKLWDTLPLNVRQEVARRERDMLPVMQQAADHKQKIDAMVSVMAPHRDRILNGYGDPVKAIDSLLRTEAVLHSGSQSDKAQLIARLVKQFNVDVRALDSALVGSALPEDVQQQSSIEELLERRLAPMQQFIQSQQQREAISQQQKEQQVTSAVYEMAQDERYPYFDEVRADMADIIEMSARRGIAVSLPDAYTKAIRMNDGAFQASSVREQSQGATQSALEAHRAAHAAKGASVSVTGSPTGIGKTTGDASNLRGLIENAFGGGRL